MLAPGGEWSLSWLGGLKGSLEEPLEARKSWDGKRRNDENE